RRINGIPAVIDRRYSRFRHGLRVLQQPKVIRGILLNDSSAFHDESNASNCRNVARGIAVDSDQVGKQAVSYSTNPIFHVQDLRVDGCCRAQSIKRSHSEINHRFEFAAVLAVSKDTNIAAAGYRDTRIERSLETRTLS